MSAPIRLYRASSAGIFTARNVVCWKSGVSSLSSLFWLAMSAALIAVCGYAACVVFMILWRTVMNLYGVMKIVTAHWVHDSSVAITVSIVQMTRLGWFHASRQIGIALA